MKSLKKFLVLVICFMFVPAFINAETDDNTKEYFNVTTGDNVTMDSVVDGSSVTAGNTVTSNGTVKGIDFNFGETVTYKGNSDYALLAGLNVIVEGTINNDGLILGDLINFNETFESKRDLFVFGSSVNLKGKVERDITIYATSVTIENAVITGNIKIMATDITINDNVEVLGQLSYNKDINANISSNASINETVLLESLEYTPSFGEKVASYIMSLLGTLVLFAALNLVVPNLFKKIEENSKDKTVVDYFSLLGYGALAFILVPILSIILLTVSITQPLAFLIIALYIIAMLLSNIFVGYLLGYIIWTKLIKKEENRYLIALLGILLLSIITIIPTVGALISVIALMINMGIIVQLFRRK